jgi:hypothetical protein
VAFIRRVACMIRGKRSVKLRSRNQQRLGLQTSPASSTISPKGKKLRTSSQNCKKKGQPEGPPFIALRTDRDFLSQPYSPSLCLRILRGGILSLMGYYSRYGLLCRH